MRSLRGEGMTGGVPLIFAGQDERAVGAGEPFQAATEQDRPGQAVPVTTPASRSGSGVTERRTRVFASPSRNFGIEQTAAVEAVGLLPMTIDFGHITNLSVGLNPRRMVLAGEMRMVGRDRRVPGPGGTEGDEGEATHPAGPVTAHRPEAAAATLLLIGKRFLQLGP